LSKLLLGVVREVLGFGNLIPCPAGTPAYVEVVSTGVDVDKVVASVFDGDAILETMRPNLSGVKV
jgi:hypothetical protein